MKKIILIGAGQLGSRHLQAIKTVEESLDILVVDPSNDSLDITKQRYEQVETKTEHKISFANNIDDFKDKDVFAAVVATSSNVRFKVMSDLITKCNVKNLLLEKILFQNFDDYEKAIVLSGKHNVSCWVNCCMRMQEVYHKIASKLNSETLNYQVTGSQYGFVTNAIHYLDHASFLAGSTDFTLSTQSLDKNIIDSKRPGFFELNGRLMAEYSNGAHVELSCHASGDKPVLIEISDENNHYIFKENEDSYLYSSSETGWEWSESKLGLRFQSQLTNLFIAGLLKGETIRLPELNESTKVHLNLLKPLKDFLDANGFESSTDFPFT